MGDLGKLFLGFYHFLNSKKCLHPLYRRLLHLFKTLDYPIFELRNQVHKSTPAYFKIFLNRDFIILTKSLFVYYFNIKNGIHFFFLN